MRYQKLYFLKPHLKTRFLLFNICWIKQPDDFLGKNSNLTYPRPTGLMGPPKAPDNNFGSVDPLGGLWGYPNFLCSEKIAPIDLAQYIIQDGPHWGPMDSCGGPVGMYSQT